MYSYAYLVWCLCFALVWVVFYYARKDTRRQMLLMSLFSTPLGPLTQYLHTFDYWLPLTITGTRIGPEDFIIAFCIGGITAGLYHVVMDQTHVRRTRGGILSLIILAYVAGTVLLYGGFFILGLSSVTVAFVALSVFSIVPLILKPWILRGALLTAFMFGGFLFMFELIFFALHPGIVDAWWFGATWGRLFGVPYEELVWGFLWGLAGASGTELVARLQLPRYSRTNYGS